MKPLEAEIQLYVCVHWCWRRSWSICGNHNTEFSIGLCEKNSSCLLKWSV